MKKTKKIRIVLLVLCVCAALSGCRLALDEQTRASDRFVGFSVLLRDAFSDSPSVDRRLPHEVDGRLLIVFTASENDQTYVASESDEWFSDVRLHVKTTEAGEEYFLSGSLYVWEEQFPSNLILEVEHVYQREDGSLYAVDNGSNYSGMLSGLEIKISEDVQTTDMDGKSLSLFCEATLSVVGYDPPASARLIEISADGETTAVHALSEGTEIWLSPDAEWVLLEETLSNGSVRRTALNAPLDETGFELFWPEENGVCVPTSYTLRQP